MMAGEKSRNLQEVFLNNIRKSHSAVTVFLVNGVKLQGVITWFDNFSILLKRDQHVQLVYKHAISTIMPVGPIQLQEFDDKDTGSRVNDGMPGKMEERPPIVPALKEVVADLLREGADRFILPRFQNLSSQDIATKSSETDFVTIADQETEAWLIPNYSKHNRV